MGDGAAEVERLRSLFQDFAASQCRGRSLVYERLSEGLADDDGLLGLLLSTPGEQRRPSLFFAAVNVLLASHPDSALAAYYATHGGRRQPDTQLLPALSTFCAEHRDQLGRLLRERSTQTNEIRRCVALRLGLAHVHRHWPGPLALVEVGASAGLNLLFDYYSYRLNGEPLASAAPSPVVVSCEVRGGTSVGRLLAASPEITWRMGIDEHPVNLADPEARAWLEAFIWPEHVDDLATLRAAVNLSLSIPNATVVRGEATTDTVRLLSGLAGDEPIVVFTASLLTYLRTDARAAFVGQLQEVAAHRPVAWVFAEAPGLLATTDTLASALVGPLRRRNSLYTIGTSLRSPPGGHDDELLALADPYLRWFAPARGPTDDFQWVN
jgi:hypothetical protein